ncbi:toxin-antitoxin system YwqK family antitoxin [Robertkochia sediminum]|uniref:toxin-antitoxin system YwqK family antitoxin n=1 Tax=Robertkochia sediminum TaxID=2785326 RepID=UPI0019334A5E|nr:hypothetical protein [Robertkochia sediminum]MBL7473298.1 hypothetical protein [Robertkochia sediminum]
MKKLITTILIVLPLFIIGQEQKKNFCDCEELTMKGKTGKAAYLKKKPFSGICLKKNEKDIVLEQRSYFNAQLTGETKIFNPTGQLIELITFSHNLKNGQYKLYNEKGLLIIEGKFQNNLKQGEWKFYSDSTGELEKSVLYERGNEKNSR